MYSVLFLSFTVFCAMIYICYFRSYRKKVATTKFVHWPIEIRFCALNTNTNQSKSDPRLGNFSGVSKSHLFQFFWKYKYFMLICINPFSCHLIMFSLFKFYILFENYILLYNLRYWFRAKGKLSDDQALHRSVIPLSAKYFSFCLYVFLTSCGCSWLSKILETFSAYSVAYSSLFCPCPCAHTHPF